MRTWLTKEPQTVVQCLLLIGFVLLLNYVYHLVVMSFLVDTLGGFDQIRMRETIEEMLRVKMTSTVHFLAFLISGVIVEELTYRAFPLFIAIQLGSKKYVVVILVLISSVVFGFDHGGPVYILMQGVTGLVYSFLFLTCGGWRGALFKPFAVSTTAHLIWNLFWIL